MSKSDVKLYSANEIESARTKGKIIGWIQGAGAMLLLSFAFSMIGWIPTIAVAALVGYVLVKLLK